MGRVAAPFVDVAGLTLAIRLFVILKDIPSREEVNERQYIDRLGKELEKFMVVKASSRNQIIKLIGKPYQKDREKADGIDTTVLNRLAYAVFKLLYKDSFQEKEKNFPWWKSFLDSILNSPSNIKALDHYKYYKYLPEGKKDELDSFVNSRIAELGIDKDTHNYIVYFWGDVQLGVLAAHLQINKRTQEVIYYYYKETEDGWVPNTTFKASREKGDFLLSNNFCVLHLLEPDPDRTYKRLTMYLRVTKDFYAMETFKGHMLFFTTGFDIPTTCEVVVKSASYVEVRDTIMTKKLKIPNEIFLELIGRRFASHRLEVSYDEGLVNVEMRSERAFQQVTDVLKGTYYFGYIAGSESVRKDSLVFGVAEFEDQGYVNMKLAHFPKPLRGYVDNFEFISKDIVKVNPLDGEDTTFSFFLNIKGQIDDYGKLKKECLEGKYIGAREKHVIGGNIIFYPTDHRTLNKIEEAMNPRYVKKEDFDSNMGPEIRSLIDYFISIGQILPKAPTDEAEK